MPKDYITALAGTPKYAAVEFLYGEYINGHPELKTSQEVDVAAISATISKQLDAHSVSDETICDYEEAARRAGFYAGFRAGAAYIQYINSQQRQQW